MNTIIKAGIFWTGTRTAISFAIRWFTRPGYRPGLAEVSHMGLIFEFADGEKIIHEALLSEGYCEKPAARLLRFEGKTAGNRMILAWLPLDAARAQALYEASKDQLGKHSYAVDQIAAFMICKSLIGRLLRLTVSTGEGRVVCSEITARLLAPFGFDLRDRTDESFDSVVPQEALDQYRLKYTP